MCIALEVFKYCMNKFNSPLLYIVVVLLSFTTTIWFGTENDINNKPVYIEGKN
jgi:hypothetical protein